MGREKEFTAFGAACKGLTPKLPAPGSYRSGTLSVYGINFPIGEVEWRTCMGGVFVDTTFHAHRSGGYNIAKQTGIPSIWGAGMNGQSG